MARLKILTPKEIHAVYGIPEFTPEERDIYFSLDPREKQVVDSIRTFVAKVYFVLQLGYFKTKKQFFIFDLRSAADDVAYILRKHLPDAASLSDIAISKPTRLAQQAEILQLMDYQLCSPEWKRKLQEKACQLAVVYTKPVYIFKELMSFLEHHRVVLPGYSFLQEKVIGRAITGEQKRLEHAVVQGIPEEQRLRLDALLTAEENFYQLTLLKHEPKDFSYQEAQKEVGKRMQLADLYHLAADFLPKLLISNENVKYYASLVSYYTMFNLRRLSRGTVHAYLLCFISYRYQMVHDNLINTFLYHVGRFVDQAGKAAKEQIGQERLEANRHLEKAGRILDFFTDDALPNEMAFGVVKQKAFGILAKDQFALVSQYLRRAIFDETAYEWQQYAKIALKFKLRLRHLFAVIPFESQTPNNPLLTAATFLKEAFERDKSLREYSQKAIPQECIPEKLRKYLYEMKEFPWYGKTKRRRALNTDKYEFLIYKLLKKGIDAGDIFIRDSRNFKSLEDDIISDELWQQKDTLIKSLNLPFLQDPIGKTLATLETELEATIQRVNGRIARGENPDVKISGSGDQRRWRLPYRSEQENVEHPLFSQLPPLGIVDVLLFAHRRTGCFSPFTHLLSRYGKQGPEIPLLIACILAFGENIGLNRMAGISDISLQELLTIARDFVRLETLRPANDLITNSMARLPIFKYYDIDEEVIHGSIDGQKLDTQIETINARHSPKYFALGKGISSITLVANNIPVNAKIIGTHEHESRFVFDLLYNNTSDVDPHILSTDTHGTNQINHALLHIFGYQFAPRYKQLDSEHREIYGFCHPQFYKGLLIKPVRKINKDLIIVEEDNIKRIVVSLALKSTTQSTIVRKLSSYERKNRTKKALWELDNVIKSLYILNYIDDLTKRQGVQKALNRGEAYHQLKRAIFHDNQGRFRVRTELEQYIWSECSRLIANSIIFCNAFIQSTLLTLAEKGGRQEEADIIKRVSPIAWRHVNLRGRFEFQKQHAEINIEEIVKTLQKETDWRKPESVGDLEQRKSYFTFRVR